MARNKFSKDLDSHLHWKFEQYPHIPYDDPEYRESINFAIFSPLNQEQLEFASELRTYFNDITYHHFKHGTKAEIRPDMFEDDEDAYLVEEYHKTIYIGSDFTKLSAEDLTNDRLRWLNHVLVMIQLDHRNPIRRAFKMAIYALVGGDHYHYLRLCELGHVDYVDKELQVNEDQDDYVLFFNNMKKRLALIAELREKWHTAYVKSNTYKWKKYIKQAFIGVIALQVLLWPVVAQIDRILVYGFDNYTLDNILDKHIILFQLVMLAIPQILVSIPIYLKHKRLEQKSNALWIPYEDQYIKHNYIDFTPEENGAMSLKYVNHWMFFKHNNDLQKAFDATYPGLEQLTPDEVERYDEWRRQQPDYYKNQIDPVYEALQEGRRQGYAQGYNNAYGQAYQDAEQQIRDDAYWDGYVIGQRSNED